jgi:hypothetical protein
MPLERPEIQSHFFVPLSCLTVPPVVACNAPGSKAKETFEVALLLFWLPGHL